MKIQSIIYFIVCLMWSCGSNQAEMDDSMSKSVSSAELEMADSSSAFETEAPLATEYSMKDNSKSVNNETVANNSSSNPAKHADTIYLKNVRLSKKFIKTAEMQFKVKSVENVTHRIESLAVKMGGFVEQSAITSNVVSEKDIPESADSLIKVTEYYVNNQLIIRVPSQYFDSALIEISKLYLYLNSRTVKSIDVSTEFLRSKLKAEMRTEYEKRIQKASDQGNKRLDDVVNAERTASELGDLAIDNKIKTYELQDQIDYSTINLNIYQANSISKEWIANTMLAQYKPGFWTRVWKALIAGWEIIQYIIIGLLYLWPMYLIAAGLYYFIRYLRNKRSKNI